MDRSAQQTQPLVRLPKISLHFAVEPDKVFGWEFAAESELRVYRERVWLTRLDSDYDYWLEPGETIRLPRWARIRISTDANAAAEISVTSAYVGRSGMIGRWLDRAASLVFGRLGPSLRRV
ncbi:MAG TPA: DUF2917 domain-containing protein [Paraburkholderia sp.]|jgi:hypothetical protein